MVPLVSGLSGTGNPPVTWGFEAKSTGARGQRYYGSSSSSTTRQPRSSSAECPSSSSRRTNSTGFNRQRNRDHSADRLQWRVTLTTGMLSTTGSLSPSGELTYVGAHQIPISGTTARCREARACCQGRHGMSSHRIRRLMCIPTCSSTRTRAGSSPSVGVVTRRVEKSSAGTVFNRIVRLPVMT